MNRLLIAGGLVVAIFVSGVTIGYKLATGKQAKQEVKIITKKVENQNEDIISLQEHTKEIAKLQKQYKQKLANIPVVVSPSDCSVSDYQRVWDEAIGVANTVHVEDRRSLLRRITEMGE
jgi:hypothetical protein